MLVWLMVEFEEVSFFLSPCVSVKSRLLMGFVLVFFFLAHPFRAGVRPCRFFDRMLEGI